MKNSERAADKERVLGILKDCYNTECRRIFKSEGTIWVTGTHHNIHQCGYLLQKNDFKILNDISWYIDLTILSYEEVRCGKKIDH